MTDETENDNEEDGLTTLEELEAPDGGAGFWFTLMILGGVAAGIILLILLIIWLVGKM